MRRISFSMTEPQFLDGSKTVTRRLGWKTLEAGTHLIAIRKGMGLKRGEKQVVLGEIEVTSVLLVPLKMMSRREAALEGYPGMTGAEFVRMFCRKMRCTPDTIVTRIEFKRVPPAPQVIDLMAALKKSLNEERA